jgi:predicted RNA-binding protein Jag
MKEFFGIDVQDALKKAAAYFNTAVESLKYRPVDEIVPNSKRAVKAAVLVEAEEVKNKPGELTPQERQALDQGGQAWLLAWCQGVLRRLGLAAQVGIEEQDGLSLLRVSVDGNAPFNKAAMGQLRGCLQHLLARLTVLEDANQKNFFLDIGGDLEKREQRMAYLAEKTKKYMELQKSWLGFHLLDYQDRRLLHLALKKHGLESESSGEGKFRLLQVGKYGGYEIGREKQRQKAGRRGAGKGKVPDADRRSR